MATRRTVTTESGARELATHLLDPARAAPVVVVTSFGHHGPIPVDEVVAGVGDLVEVYSMPTGDATWAFKAAMPPLTQVFGDAARVYAVDPEWQTNPYASRLHMCHHPEQGARIADALVSEAMQAAAAAGLLAQRVVGARSVEAEVTGTVSGRAFVKGSFGFGYLREELIADGIDIDHLVRKGMRIAGRFDEGSKFVDVSESMLDPESALSVYVAGDVVPARVRTVGAGVAAVELHPSRVVEIRAAAILGADAGDLNAVLSVGEVVLVRVERTGQWILSMLDIDEDAARSACSLLLDGPPWIELAVDADEVEPPQVEAELVEPAPEPAGTGAASDSAETIALRDEVAQLRMLLARAEREAVKRNNELEHVRTQHRKALTRGKKSRDTARAERVAAFLDAEEQLRHEVYLDWVERIPAGEKAARPLPEAWTVGESFMESLAGMPAEVRERVPETVMEVLTHIAEESDGRELHRLRTGSGGADPYQERASGEYCWRVAVQRNTPSAARLHFWRLGEHVELSRVVRHDDMRP